MFLVLWEFEVKPGYEERFESVYGPGGDWEQVFRQDPNYLHTQLLRDPARARFYVTLDFWKTRDSHDTFKQRNHETYATLDETCRQLTSLEKKLGEYEQLRR